MHATKKKKKLLSKFTPRWTKIQDNIPGRTVFPNWWRLDWSRAELGYNIQQVLQKGLLEHSMVPRSAYQNNFPISQEVLNFLQKAIAFQWISPPFLVQARFPSFILRTFFPQHRSSRIDQVLKFGDSMIIHHKSCQIQWLVSIDYLLTFLTPRENFSNSSPSPVKSLFCTEAIQFFEWQDPEHEQRTGDCSVFHPRWEPCDQQLSNHHTLLLEILLRQCVFCKEQQISQFRCFGKRR